MNTFFQHLRDPEYMHVLLNPIPVYGLAFGTLSLVLALVLRNNRVTIAALVLLFIAGISAWPVYQYGESAYDRVKSMSDQPGEQWLDEHMARGEKLIWTFYVLAGVAAVGVAVTTKWPQNSRVVSVVALALSSVTLGMGGYISYAGGMCAIASFVLNRRQRRGQKSIITANRHARTKAPNREQLRLPRSRWSMLNTKQCNCRLSSRWSMLS